MLPATARGGWWRRLGQRVAGRVRAKWPQLRRTLPRDLAILLLLFLLTRQVGVAWVMTDSIHKSLAVILKGAAPKQGELAAFAYAGDVVPNYYAEVPSTKWAQKLGMNVRLDGPAKGDGFIKYLWGVPGDRIEVVGRKVYLINRKGRYFMGDAKPQSRHGAPLTPIKSQTIPEGYVYMWSPHIDALDSRYSVVGLVPRQNVFGKGVALW
jgi:hypothetical protein